MAIRFRYTVLLFLSVLIEGVSAQLPEKDFYFHHIMTEQGLSYGVVNDIFKSKDGYIWIATYNGLNRFDGSHFKIWKANPSDKNALPSNAIQSICEDSEANIWMATDGGIVKFNRLKFENFHLLSTDNGKEQSVIPFEIITTKAGEIIASTSNGLFIYNKGQNKFIQCLGNKENHIRPKYTYKNAFVEDTTLNGIWIGSWEGMWFFDLSSHEFYNYKYNLKHFPILNDHAITTITMNRHKELIIYDWNEKSIVTFNVVTNNISKESILSWQIGRAFVSTIFVDKFDNKWVSTWANRSFFEDHNNGKWYEFKHYGQNNYSVSACFFWGIREDEDGTIYLGTTNGISYTNLQTNFFSIVPLPAGVNHVTDYLGTLILNTDKQNNIWLAPNWQYLLKYSPGDNSYKRYDLLSEAKKRHSQFPISSMVVTQDTLYIGTVDGIYIYDVRTEHFSRLKYLPDSLFKKGDGILTMMLAKNNELWFSNLYNGLFRYNLDSHSYKHYVYDSTSVRSISSKTIIDVHQNIDGSIWISTVGDGLAKYVEKTDDFEYISRINPHPVFKFGFSRIQNDKAGNLWLLSGIHGLVKFNSGTGETKLIYPKSSLSNLVYGSMYMDENENLWLGFYYQYTIYNINKNTTENFEIDYSKDNLRYMSSFNKMADGRVAFESFDAFIIVDPKKRTAHASMEPIIISGFNAGDISYDFLPQEQEVNLKRSQNSFSIDFSTMSFLKDNNIKFSYMLEGLDKDWVDCGSRQTAYYTNISGGDYTFKVRAKETNGTWKEAAHPLQIKINKIFYSTIWFRLFLIVSLGGCIAWYINIIKRRRLRKEADKAISYFANSLQGRNKVEELLWDITHNVITRTNLTDCVVYLVDEQKDVLIQKAAFGDKNPDQYEILNPIEIPIGKGIVGSVAKTGIAEIIPDTSKDSRYIPDDTNRFSEIAVPIIAEKKVIGVIDSEHPNKNFFTKEHLSLLTTIASITATKIIKAQKEMEIEENEKRLHDLQAQVVQTRQQALQAQMNPHFIFNCLNSINGFILKNDVNSASTFLIKFSKLIRLILEHSNEKSIPLQSELDALKLYIEMEALRFEKKFTYEIFVAEDVMPDFIQVPPLILQPFVENSIWHGLLHSDKERRLQISVLLNNGLLECVIEDNGIGRAASEAFKSKNKPTKKSLALKLTTERIGLMNMNGSGSSSIRILDLTNADGSAAGTKVIITMPVVNEFN